MKKLVLFISVLFINLLFIPNVFAKNINLAPTDFTINGSEFYTGIRAFTFYSHQDANTSTTVNLSFVQSSAEPIMQYFVMDICSTQAFRVERYNKGECHIYGCLINPRVYDTKKTCDADGYQGRTYRVYTDIVQWEIGSGNVSLYQVDTRLKFYPRQYETYSRFGNIINAYLSDTDDGTSLENAQLISGSINDVNSSVQDTNDKLDDTNNKLDETNKELGDLNDNITNSNTDNPSSKFEEFENMLPENGVITQLITLPISLFQKVLGSINSSCTQYNLGNLLGTDLILPCINISNYIGTTLWNVIDILFSGFFILVIGKKMIKAFNGFTSMEEGDVLD